MEHRQRIKVAAKKYLNEFGVSVIPLGLAVTDSMPEKQKIDHQKRPDRAWTEFQDRQATVEESQSWNCLNLGLVTGGISGIIVVDCESREDAEWFFKTRGRSNTIVQTPRGFHFYFQTPGCHVPNAQRIEGRYDIRGDGGYVVAPPSVVNGKRYQFVEKCGMKSALELPVFDMRWRYPQGQGPQPKEARKITDGRKYIMTMRAVSGEAGHNVTWKACQRLKDSGMTESEALATMIEWNQTNCEPPWSTAELLHKVQGVYS